MWKKINFVDMSIQMHNSYLTSYWPWPERLQLKKKKKSEDDLFHLYTELPRAPTNVTGNNQINRTVKRLDNREN